MSQKPSQGDTDRMLRIFVKQGAKRRFDRLKRDSASLPVDVHWDRRSGERRSAAEAEGAEAVGLPARNGERRQAPAFTWDLADFVVVEGADN